MLSVTESAAILDISPSRVRALIAQGQLPAQKVGNAWILKEEDVMQRITERPKNAPRCTRVTIRIGANLTPSLPFTPPMHYYIMRPLSALEG